MAAFDKKELSERERLMEAVVERLLNGEAET